MSQLGDLIKARRQELGLTREVVAVHSGVSVATVLRLENDLHLTRVEKLEPILKTLGLKLSDVAALLDKPVAS